MPTTGERPPDDVFARLTGHTRDTKIGVHADKLVADAIATARLAVEHSADVVAQVDQLRASAGLPASRRNVAVIATALATAFATRLARRASERTGA